MAELNDVDVATDEEDNENEATAINTEINIEDEAVKDRWSRYIGAMGIEAVAKQSAANIFLSGAGALGIEALSRGARRVVFVDNSPESLKLIRRNLAFCGYESESTLLKKDLARGLPAIPDLGEGVDLVFADPPYRKDYLLPILIELSASSLLSSHATIVLEAGKEEHLPETVGKLSLAKTRVYGDTKIFIYSYGGHET